MRSLDAPHIDAAMAWIGHATASVRFVFVKSLSEFSFRRPLLARRAIGDHRSRSESNRRASGNASHYYHHFDDIK
jgi:putative DNA primase/helicase